jgi:hypothetical protein
MTSRLLEDRSNGSPSKKVPKSQDECDAQDSGYFATYSHYDIHQEMLQVSELNSAWHRALSLLF